MPGVRAKRLCPDAVFLPADFAAYRAHTNRFREVLLAQTPLEEPISLDEAFLDVGGATSLFGPPPTIAAKIRADVDREVGVTCSVGVASTKFVAKLASDGCKPDGMLVVPADGVLAYLEPLPVGRLWGVGEKTGDLLAPRDPHGGRSRPRRPVGQLPRRGDREGTWSSSLRGSDREVVPLQAPKSVGHEETFDRDLDDDDEIARGSCACRARWRGSARTATGPDIRSRLAWRTTTLTRARRSRPNRRGRDLYHVALTMYQALPGIGGGSRLLGVQASGLGREAEQLACSMASVGVTSADARPDQRPRFGTGAATLGPLGPRTIGAIGTRGSVERHASL
jgi:DNA polymerase-4